MGDSSSSERDAASVSEGHALPGNHSLIRAHLAIGWVSLVAFVTMGILLEYMHGFRVPSYMNVGEAEIRRQMWTLAHAHGVLISLVHIAFAATLYITTSRRQRGYSVASACLTAAGILMPLGFFLGGVYVYPGDPGMGIFLVPPGAILLLAAVSLVAIGVTRESRQAAEG